MNCFGDELVRDDVLKMVNHLPFILFKNIYLFIWLHSVLVAAHGIFSCSMRTLSCGMWDVVPWQGIEPRPAALEKWSLSHSTAREVPHLPFKIKLE